jgi:hypothetical protein
MVAGVGLVLCMNLAACGPKLPKSVNQDALEQSIAMSMGDMNTCVVLADRATGKIAWSTGLKEACRAKYPACTADKSIDVNDLAKQALSGVTVTTGCSLVSWAAGTAGKSTYVYAAVMSGERALPGREMSLRLDSAFAAAGL